jgi:dTDP-glucose 4,6-dehydratase
LKVLVTGGAGFIGRGVVSRLIDQGIDAVVLDNLSNSNEENLEALTDSSRFKHFVSGDIKDKHLLSVLFEEKFDICFHLAASIIVQDSIDNPAETFENDVIGTFNILEHCRKTNTKMVFVSTCMVYDAASADKAINEMYPTKPASPYAGAKLAGESMVESYYHAYGLPTVIVRPFNTYGPWQKSTGEGGVVSIFIERELKGQNLDIYGDGTQTRDLLYVDDCADFIVRAGLSDKANGHILCAGYGQDVTVNELASLVCKDSSRIRHVPHIHPQSEIMKLQCDYSKAKDMLGWTPSTALLDGIRRTTEWIKQRIGA